MQLPTDTLAKRGWTHTVSSAVLPKTINTTRFLGSHGGLNEESRLLGCYVAKQWPIIRTGAVPTAAKENISRSA